MSMRTRLLTLILASLPAAAPQVAAALAIGDAMPLKDVAMKNVDGTEVTLAEVAGEKGTLVLFSCNSCPWVKAWEERITALGNEVRRKGVGVIAVNSNDPSVNSADGFEHMQQRAKERGFAFPYAVDEGSRLAKAFGATRTPEAFLFDSSARLAYHGTIDDNAQNQDAVEARYLHDAIEALLAGRDVSPKETKSLGCTIKFYD